MSRLQTRSDLPLAQSSWWKTEPVNCPPGSPPFVNVVAGLVPRAGETPETLLGFLLELEREFGRRPKVVLNEARPLDLDLITFRSERRATPTLIVPHPRAHLRRFVLAPLAEIAPALVMPGQQKSVKELLAELPAAEAVERLG